MIRRTASLGEVRRLAGRLDDARQTGQERRRELLSIPHTGKLKALIWTATPGREV